MTWQEWVETEAGKLGLKKTSGYRSPQAEAALGGPASSYHTKGSPETPGAIDFGGSAAALKQLFDEIKQAFAGRVSELYLNLPGGTSQDIKNNRTLNRNPEEGRARHLHVALGATVAPDGGPPQSPFEAWVGGLLHKVPMPAGGVPGGAIGAPADTSGDACATKYCLPLGHCGCWSDVWVFGAGLFLVVGGALLVFRGGGK